MRIVYASLVPVFRFAVKNHKSKLQTSLQTLLKADGLTHRNTHVAYANFTGFTVRGMVFHR